ncbi:hypothetical protein GCM10010211_49060 [Streptomyces albospinus]|uniref:Uncharacterized protein n=3 Tax=Streptomyces TaxID=1883 RepID=A0A124HGZ6_9ACTN|nr:hypothetical protein [Streptomyces albospinus]KUN08574.1 hypothetical protein AQI95_09470 [Streptomyces yokosukanensis]GGU77330.1 hypothetical protein GCM10010211_49060 [Streptomyces albospinus]
MPLNLMDIPTANGGWFKPKDNADAVAILLEVKQFDRQRPTPNGPKDSVLADVTVFQTHDALSRQAPEVSKGQRIEQTVLARDLETVVGGAVLVTVTQVPPSKPGAHPAWVWKQVTDMGIRNQVVAYAEQRDAAIQSAVADAPSFD